MSHILKNQGGRFKVVLLGDARVGKTSLVKQFMGKGFNSQYLMTIGADFSLKKIGKHSMLIWDLAGQTGFDTVRKNYYTGSTGAIAIYDITDSKSMEHIERWIDELVENNKRIVPLTLVGNKIDLRSDQGQITREQGEAFCTKLKNKYGVDVIFIETSALSGENVETMFMNMTDHIVDFIIHESNMANK